MALLPEPRTTSFIVIEDSEALINAGKACIYLLVKKGVSTPEAAKSLARILGSSAKPLGLKDTNATTAQLICVNPCPPTPPRIIRGGNFWARLLGKTRSCSKLYLAGNRFIIILEPHPGASPQDIVNVVKSLADAPLPAYYSYQRFGTRRPSTHYAGIGSLIYPHVAVLEEVVDKPYPDESPYAITCRASYWASPACKRLKRMYEARIVELFPYSISMLPGFLRSIHASALQAVIFNFYLSTRIEEGIDITKPVSGEKRNHDGRPLALVPGIGLRTVVSGESRHLLKKALEPLGLSLEDLSTLSPLLEPKKPYWRPLYTKPRNLQADIVDGRVALRFWLEKGLYATLLLREIIDPYNL